MTDYGFIRVSTGSQDAATQRRDILAVYPDAQIVTTHTRSASASKGEQVDAIYKLIGKLRKGDRIIVTDSSRLDRRDNLDAQAEVLLAVRSAGADIVSLTEPSFGTTDFPGRIVTLVAQHANAQKSLTVKNQTWRGVQDIIGNHAWYGCLPVFWKATGPRYGKHAACADTKAVQDIYSRIADGQSMSSVARSYGLWAAQVKTLIKFPGNGKETVTCRYTNNGDSYEWQHQVTPVVEPGLWMRANNVIDRNKAEHIAHRGGRPVGQVANWLSGLFSCPACGGYTYVNSGSTPAGNRRTQKLRCSGPIKKRQACGNWKGIEADLIIKNLDAMFTGNPVPLLAFQRVDGNAHELEEMRTELAMLEAKPMTGMDKTARRDHLAQMEALEDQISGFVEVPDKFDYTQTGQTLGQMWAESADSKRNIVKACLKPMALTLLVDGSVEASDKFGELEDDTVIDLGRGVCFRPFKVQ